MFIPNRPDPHTSALKCELCNENVLLQNNNEITGRPGFNLVITDEGAIKLANHALVNHGRVYGIGPRHNESATTV